jgi:predicted RNase H-like nuclease (RuvC/YqgF family)
MTLQEILKAKGLDDESIESVIGEMKQNKIFTTSHENMDIRYPKLKADHESLTTQHGESTKLIEQLKAGTKDNDALQGKITAHEATIAQLQEQLKQTQLEAAIKVALIGAKATDVDYMTFRLKEKGDLELDDQNQIKGIDDMLAGLKTQFPNFFESGASAKQMEVQKLPDRNKAEGGGMTRAEFLRKPYAERAAYANENPEAYNTIMNQK